ncbi:MAG: KpsF/GutQ family sugar-phosphate isomerase [Verrucomicrobiota bacterium]
MKYIDRAREIIDIERAGLEKVRDGLNGAFDDAVDLLLGCLENRGKIIVTGLGKCLHVGQKIAATMTSTGSPAVLLHPAEALHGDLGLICEGDVLITLTYSGESEELLTFFNHVQRLGIGKIALTGAPDSAIARHSDVVIPVTVEQEACPFNMAPTASTTAMMAVGDALAMVLLEARGFEKDDYAKLHPGGSIGRTLLLRVEDIMRTDERFARVPAGARVKDAVLAMTSARSGSVVVVDEDGTLAGIITDGDLRREMSDSTRISDELVDDLMTRNPISLKRESLAVDVLALFEKHAIDDLVVVDEENRPTGLVDIQDLPKFKIL